MLPEYRYAIYDMRVSDIPSRLEAEEWFDQLAEAFDFRIEAAAWHDFVPPIKGNAYSVNYVLSSSLAAIHTAPEHNWVQVVFASCDDLDPRDIDASVTAFWRPEELQITSFVTSVPRRRV